MDKQTKKALIVSGILLALVFLFYQGLNLEPLFAGGSGMELLSLDRIGIISNAEDLDDVFFRALTQIGVGTQEIIGTITKEELNDKLPDGYSTEFDIEISANIAQEVAKYPIVQNSVDYIRYEWIEIDEPFLGLPPDCPSGTFAVIDGQPLNRYCLVRNLNGEFGRLDEPTIEVNVNFEFKSGDNTIRRTIGNFGENSGTKEIRHPNTNELLGRVTMTQASDSVGANPPNHDSFRLLYRSGFNNWKLISKNVFDNYRIESASVYNIYNRGGNALHTGEIGCSQVNDQCVRDKLNLIFQPVDVAQFNMENNPFVFSTQGEEQLIGNSLQNSRVEYIPDQVRLTNVQMLFDFQAEWAGVRELVARPMIIGRECNEFQAGRDGTIDVTVKNDGEVGSHFDVDLVSCQNFRQLADVAQQHIPSKQSKLFQIQIDAGTNTDITSTCTIKAFNVALPDSLSDSATVSCTVVPPRECDAGDQTTGFVEGKTCVFDCQDGKYPETPSFCCESGVEPFLNPSTGKTNFRCKTGPPPPPPPPDECESCFSWLFKNKFKGDTPECSEDSFIQFRWWNPTTYLTSRLTKQSVTCPIFLSIILSLLMVLGSLGYVRFIKKR